MIRLVIFTIGMFVTWYVCSNNTHNNTNAATSHPVQKVCGRAFCVNECVAIIAAREREEWEKPRSIQKIVGVGKQAYRTIFWLDNHWASEEYSQTLTFGWEDSYEKVICPE